MLTEAQLKQYDEEGYIILEDLFGEAEMDQLTERIDQFDEATNNELKQKGQQNISIPNQIVFTGKLNSLDPHIQAFCAQDKFVQLSTALVGPDTQLFWDQSVYKRPEAHRDFPWHQDNGYVKIEPLDYMTCWLALEDATIENGCIWIQPRSHLQGVVEHIKTDIGWQCYFGDDPGLAVPLRKGSMVAFHSMLFHRSTPNRSNTIRKGYVIQYTVAGAKNAVTGEIFNNGPVIARNGKSVYVPQ